MLIETTTKKAAENLTTACARMLSRQTRWKVRAIPDDLVGEPFIVVTLEAYGYAISRKYPVYSLIDLPTEIIDRSLIDLCRELGEGLFSRRQ